MMKIRKENYLLIKIYLEELLESIYEDLDKYNKLQSVDTTYNMIMTKFNLLLMQNELLIRQNEEIIEVLKEIVKK